MSSYLVVREKIKIFICHFSFFHSLYFSSQNTNTRTLKFKLQFERCSFTISFTPSPEPKIKQPMYQGVPRMCHYKK